MAANLTIYCLDQVTDYSEFERLCHDLMSLNGYHSIEPLGGLSDKGRDAIHVNESSDTTIFAYSVREDWRAKLAEDASKIHKHGHPCNQLVFVTASKVTANRRDEAIKYVRDEFGWKLELYDVERLRVLLDVEHSHIKKQHPSIFPPDFLVIQNRVNASTERDHLFISCVPEDGALADWLVRKLTAEGYLVWCERFNLLGGERYPTDVDDAIKNQTFRFLGLYSQVSLKNPEVMRQRMFALNIASERNQEFIIPLNVDGVSEAQLDEVTKALRFLLFQHGWASGLKQLLRKLKSINCPQMLCREGKRIAAETFLGTDLLSETKETLFSNCLRVLQIPEVIYSFKVSNALPEETLNKLKLNWSFRSVDPYTYLSFHKPPASLMKEYGISENGGSLWHVFEKINGISSLNLVSELIRKSLIVKCSQEGLQYCDKTNLLYFPSGSVKNNRLYLACPDDGSKTYVASCGKRNFWPIGEYLYYLAPSFSVCRDLFGNFTILIRIRIRLADTDGKALTNKRTIDSRRKHLCRNWWNKEWLNRILAVSQFLADDESKQKITIGDQQDTQIVVDTMPLHFHAPIGINETALDGLSLERAELLSNYTDEDLENDSDLDEIND